MSASYELVIQLKRDGHDVPGFPVTRRVTVDEGQSFQYEKSSGAGYVALPTGELAEINLLYVRSDQQVTLRLDGQTDAGLVVKANGLLLAVDVDIDAGASTNATVENTSGSTANIKGVAGGT